MHVIVLLPFENGRASCPLSCSRFQGILKWQFFLRGRGDEFETFGVGVEYATVSCAQPNALLAVLVYGVEVGL